MKKLITLGLISIFSLAALILLVRMSREVPADPDSRKGALQYAERWITENSPTWLFDGMDLELESSAITPTGNYGFVFRFVSRHAGYGSRDGEFLAQVLTDHLMAVEVEEGPPGDFTLVAAVTDGVFDEIRGVFIEQKAATSREISIFFMTVTDGIEMPVPAIRKIAPGGKEIERAAMEELLKGPSPEEREKGYFTAINDGVKILSLDISDGLTTVSFSRRLDEGVAGSATVYAIRDQIERTLMQFDSVSAVEIAVDGKTEDILQP